MQMHVGDGSSLLYMHATNASSTNRRTNSSLTSVHSHAVILFPMTDTGRPAGQLTASLTTATGAR